MLTGAETRQCVSSDQWMHLSEAVDLLILSLDAIVLYSNIDPKARTASTGILNENI